MLGERLLNCNYCSGAGRSINIICSGRRSSRRTWLSPISQAKHQPSITLAPIVLFSSSYFLAPQVRPTRVPPTPELWFAPHLKYTTIAIISQAIYKYTQWHPTSHVVLDVWKTQYVIAGTSAADIDVAWIYAERCSAWLSIVLLRLWYSYYFKHSTCDRPSPSLCVLMSCWWMMMNDNDNTTIVVAAGHNNTLPGGGTMSGWISRQRLYILRTRAGSIYLFFLGIKKKS